MILVNILIQIHISISLAADADFKQIMEMQVKFLMTIHSLPGFSAQHKCRLSLWQLIKSEFHRVFFSFSPYILSFVAKCKTRCCYYSSSVPITTLIKIELVESLVHSLVLLADILVALKHLFLCTSELATDAAINTCFLIIEHINIKIPHKT